MIILKWKCARCETVNRGEFCKKCHGSQRRFYSEYIKEKKRKPQNELSEPKNEKRYRLISESVLLLHYLFLLVPVISIKGANRTHTYSALGMLYDLSPCVYIFALLAVSAACVYFFEILPKVKKSLIVIAMVVNVLSFSITPMLILFGKFTGFTLTFGGVVYILFTVLGEVSLILYYRSLGNETEEESLEREEYVKQFETPKKEPEAKTYYQQDYEYKPNINIEIKHEFIICPMCGEKVKHGTANCPKCNTLLLRNAPSRDITSNSKYK